MSRWSSLSLLLWGLCATSCEAPQSAPEPSSSETSTASSQPLDAAAEVPLVFKREGEAFSTRTLGELIQAQGGTSQWEAFDPYYGKNKRWRTIKLLPVLKTMFELNSEQLRAKSFVMRAQDGYSVPISGEKLITDDAYLALEDLDAPEWELTEKGAHPGPLYLVWRRPEHHDLEQWPRPYQLTEIDLASYEQTFSRTIPRELKEGSEVARGFEIFKTQCVRCHAINQHGGHVGPELNVPQNITEYRPEAQIRAYIKDPKTFRYGNMPAFAHLTERQLDELLAYLRAMRDQKFDPAEAPGADEKGG